MRKMQCFCSFVTNYAKVVEEGERADNQRSDAYSSFIVRLSFVYPSFKVRSFFKLAGVTLVVKRVDYQGRSEVKEVIERGKGNFALFAIWGRGVGGRF